MRRSRSRYKYKYLAVDFPCWDGFSLLPLSDLRLDFDSFVSYVVLRLARSLLHNTNTKSAFSNTNTSIN